MRAVELDERLATQRRGHWSAAELLAAATTTGHASLGWADAGLDRGRPARRPGHPRPRLAAHGRRGHRRARRGLRRERRPTSSRWSPTAGSSHPATRRRDRPRPRPRDPGWWRRMSVAPITGIGELTTNDPAPATDSLGLVEDAAVVVEGGTVAWVGPAADAPAADTRVDAGGRAVVPGLRGQPQPPGVRGRPGAGVRRPDDRAALRGRRHPHHRRGHPRRHRRAAHLPRRPARRRDAGPGHHHRRDQERIRAVGPRRGAQPRGGPPVHRRDDLPRRPRRARGARPPRTTSTLVTGPMLEAAAPARPLDRRLLRGRRLRRRPGASDPRRRAPTAACADACTPTS